MATRSADEPIPATIPEWMDRSMQGLEQLFHGLGLEFAQAFQQAAVLPVGEVDRAGCGNVGLEHGFHAGAECRAEDDGVDLVVPDGTAPVEIKADPAKQSDPNVKKQLEQQAK